MPPGCGRVVITQRSIGLITSSTTEPIDDVLARRARSRPRHRRRRRRRCRGSDGGPSRRSTRSPAPTPGPCRSRGTCPAGRPTGTTPSRPRPRSRRRSRSARCGRRPARVSVTGRSSQSDSAPSSVVTVPSGQLDLDVVGAQPAGLAEQQLGHPAGRQGQAGRRVDERPLAVADDAEVIDRRRVQRLALHRLHRVPPHAHHSHPVILPSRRRPPAPAVDRRRRRGPGRCRRIRGRAPRRGRRRPGRGDRGHGLGHVGGRGRVGIEGDAEARSARGRRRWRTGRSRTAARPSARRRRGPR